MPQLDLEDRRWYAVAPAVGYLIEAGAGIALFQTGLLPSAFAPRIEGMLQAIAQEVHGDDGDEDQQSG